MLKPGSDAPGSHAEELSRLYLQHRLQVRYEPLEQAAGVTGNRVSMVCVPEGTA